VDENGVDVIQEAFTASQTDVSIGPNFPHGLSYTRLGTGAGWSNVVASISGSGPYTVTYNGISDSFAGINPGSSLSGDGATLYKSGTTWTYTSRDGVVIVFSGPSNYEYGYYNANIAQAQSVTYPDGTIITFTYSAVYFCPGGNDGNTCPGGKAYAIRLQSVNNNLGYQLKIVYARDDIPIAADTTPYFFAYNNITSVTAINNAVEYCSPSSFSCSLTNSWPKATYSQIYQGSTLSVTDAMNRTTVYTGGADSISAMKRPASSTNNITVSYSSTFPYGVSAVTRDGITHNYAYADSGSTRTATVTDPLGHTRIYVSDTSLGVIKSYTDENGHTTTYTPDSFGRATQVTLPEGNNFQFTYDARGNVTQTTAVSKTAGTPANIVTSANYDATCANAVKCNQPNWTKDANGDQTDYAYDPTTGLITSMTQPAPTTGAVRPQVRYGYSALQAYYKNSSGSIVVSGTSVQLVTGTSACRTTVSCTGTGDETKTTTSYGPQTAGTANNLLPISSSSGAGDSSLTATASTTYDMFGNVATTTDPLGHVTASFFDADREPLGSIGPDPDGTGSLKYRARRNTYNADGMVTLTEQGTATANTLAAFNAMTTLQQVATTYDSADRKTQLSAQAGGSTYAVAQYSYDTLGRLQCTAQRMNPATFGALPSSACALATTGSYGPDRITYDTYDIASQMLKVTTGYGVTTANGFPATLQRDETTYTYSNNGKVKTFADAKNNVTTYVYDGFDRLYQTQYPSPTTPGSSNPADYEQLGYDPAGSVTSRRLRDGTSIAYGYDALNRLSGKTPPAGEHAVSYTYDNLGHSTTITGATTLTYGWDTLGRMTSETQAYGSIAYLYDLANRRTRLTWQDGTYLTYDYDNVDEMTDIKENGSTVLAGFTYDDLGERKTRTLANGTSTTYGYDSISRLTSLALAGGTNANTATLSNYSPAGEIGSHANSNDAFAWTAGITGSKAYTVNGLNQFATVVGAAQGYDGRGNLTSSGGTTYAYTSENLLKTVSGGFTLAYDPIGRLHEYDVPTATRFVYDGGMISEEVNTSGTVLRRYAFGPAGDEPIVWYEGSGTTTKRYMDQDERGSITRITDGSGNTISVNSYDEYGIPGATNQGRFGYTGQAWLSEIGLAYYKARIYSPTLGRFMQTDPIGYGDGPNWYNYVGSNPVSMVDPSGTCTIYCLSTDPTYLSDSSNIYSGPPIDVRHDPYDPFEFDNIDSIDKLANDALTRIISHIVPSLSSVRTSQKKVPQRKYYKIDCSSKLPGGFTVGDYVNAEVENLASGYSPVGPRGVGSRGPLDFKLNYKGQAPAGYLADAGNFAYGAVMAQEGYVYSFTMGGAGYYAAKNGKFGSLSDYGADGSAAIETPRGYAAQCKR
jgi:RHS repeat-associated protein